MTATAQQLTNFARLVREAIDEDGETEAELYVEEKARRGVDAAESAVRGAWGQMIARYAAVAAWRQERSREIITGFREMAQLTAAWEGIAPPERLVRHRRAAEATARACSRRSPSYHALRGAACADPMGAVACFANAAGTMREVSLYRRRLLDLALLRPAPPLPEAVHPEIYTALDDAQAAILRATMTIRAECACRQRGWAGEKEPTE